VAKSVFIVVAILILAVLLGVWGSSMVGPTQRNDLPDIERDPGIDRDASDFEEERRPFDAREITGDEGETVDGARVLAPNEPARVENRDYFEGLEEMEGAVPVEGATDGAVGDDSEMDRLLDRIEREANDARPAQPGAVSPPNGGGNAPQRNGARAAPPAASRAPAVERPDDDLVDLLDSIEQGGE
jgi:hypothetical protein